MNYLLIVVVAVLLLSMWIGWRQGFVKMLFHMVSFAAALILAGLLAPVAANVVTSSESLMDKATDKAYTVLRLEAVDEKKAELEEQLNEVELPEMIKDRLAERAGKDAFAALDVASPGEYIAKSVAILVIHAICYVVIFLIAWIALLIVSGTLNLVTKLPVLHSINEAGGLCVGLAQGVLVVWLLMAVLTACGNTEFGQNALAMVADSKVLTWLYDYNFVTRTLANMAGRL